MGMLALALVGVGLELYATRTGPAIRGDSVRYVMGARNLLAGNGFSRLSGGGELFPETGFAPLLSFVLAGFGRAGIDMYQGIRILNAVLFGAAILLTGWLIRDATRSGWLGLLGSVLILTAPNVFRWHTWLMSEPLFIFLLLVALVALVIHLRSGRWLPLVVAGLAAGMAALARYVGVSLIPAGLVGILLWGQGSRKERAVRAAAFALMAGLPFLLWMWRNAAVGGAGLANRQIRFHMFRPDALRVFLFEPTSWLLPAAIVLPRAARGLAALLALAAGPALFLMRAFRKRTWPGARPDADPFLAWLLFVLVPAYIGVLAFNSLFLDAATTYDGILRYLTPLFVLLVLLEVTTFGLAFPSGGSRKVLGAVIAVWLAALLVVDVSSIVTIARASTSEVGFTVLRQERVDLAESLEPVPTIITNNPEMVYYLTDRPAYMIPIKYDRYQQTFRQDFQDQIDLTQARLRGGSVLVMFGAPSAEESEVIGRLGIAPLRTFGDAVVYGYGP
jgi:hypothetical protein